MAAGMLRVLRTRVLQFESRLLQALGIHNPHDQFPPGLAVAALPSPTVPSPPKQSQDAKSLLDSIFDGIAWLAVPKKRRSLERRMMRRMGHQKIRKWGTPRTNIVSCLECGHWHLAHTICGKCYEEVREETDAMRAAMDEDDRLYNAPKTEVVYLYKDEVDDRPQYEGKYVVEMPKKKPAWWASNLLTRANQL